MALTWLLEACAKVNISRVGDNMTLVVEINRNELRVYFGTFKHYFTETTADLKCDGEGWGGEGCG